VREKMEVFEVYWDYSREGEGENERDLWIGEGWID
jgi:hypothetical protein